MIDADHEAAVAYICSTVRALERHRGKQVTSDTRLLVDLDIDSLEIVELVDALKSRFSVDLMAEPNLYRALHSPATLADLLCSRDRSP